MTPRPRPLLRARLLAGLLLVCGAAAALSATPIASGAGTLPAIVDLTRPGHISREARLAIDDDGDAVALFFDGDDPDSATPSCKFDVYETFDCTAASVAWPASGNSPTPA